MDFDDAASCSTTASSRDDTMCLPCSFKGNPLWCRLCGASSHAPMDLGTEDDIYGGRRPWSRYRRTDDAKTPRDPLCLPCWCVFRGSSLRVKYGNIQKYLEILRGKPEDHQRFTRAVKALIAKAATHGTIGYATFFEELAVARGAASNCETVFEDLGVPPCTRLVQICSGCDRR